MIFATVGTTLPFDELIEEIDRLASEDFFREPILVQTGTSSYQPRHCEFFKFKPSIDAEYDKASFLIIHGGTGSTLHAMQTGKPFIAFANPLAQDDHQAEFLQEVAQERSLFWSRNVADLAPLYERARAEKTAFGTSSRHRERLKYAILDVIRQT